MADTRSIVRWFAGTWLVLAVPLLILLLATDKLALHASINSHHTPWADAFFRHFTHVADGWVPTVLALLLLLLKDLRSFLMLGLSSGLSAIVVQTLKHGVFADMDRPSKFREALGSMDWVQGIDQYQHFSFPSGHSTAAFSMCIALAVVLGHRRLAVPFALMATVLAFSRVYLSQHFPQDALAGSTLGTLSGIAVHHWLYISPFAKKRWLTCNLLRRQNQ